ncbi:NADH-quinone oxidoreductase subunit C [candidate division LCP-89 bacterium B3_LCP]|uniref:NADH-quinone oxidoreductase subunit C n=1 Tax=candidate division LCP-89 bacterium B3_LCP TaxID=2012998 RepID=A0A532V629_UNCL8|nr:MAG: NADH-quinone oxidoreductase subunit C [candidate division LCP-89 bacterium B3_LCP]
MDIPAYIERLEEKIGTDNLQTNYPHDQLTITVSRDKIQEALQFLRDDDEALFDHFMDLTAVDYIGKQPRFQVVIHLVSIPKSQRIRIKINIDDDSAEMPTITGIYPAADWFERECYDLYGIRFAGHPNLKRIMLYDEFEGYPLRKDYPIRKRQPRVELRKPEVRRSDETVEPPR